MRGGKGREKAKGEGERMEGERGGREGRGKGKEREGDEVRRKRVQSTSSD